MSANEPSAVTRRVLLTGAVAVAGAGLVDAVQSAARGSTPMGRVGRTTPDARATASSLKSLLAPATEPAPISHPLQEFEAALEHAQAKQRTRQRVKQRNAARRHDAAQHKHGHGDRAHAGASNRRHGSGVKAAKHDRHAERIRRRAAEHVDLPTARIQVQTRPAYYLADVAPEPPRRTLALTIDDGPDPDWTPTVLRLLDKYRMQATFCIVGVHVASYPRLVRDIARAGHAIVNHSYSHPLNFARLNERRIVHEITANQQLIEQTVKVTPQLFRSPGGDWSRFVYRALAAYDLLPLEWDVDPEDWTLPGRRVIQRRMLRAKPNDIVLCHDGGGDRQETVRALRRVLPKWKHSGYTVVPLRVPETRWQDLQR